MILIISCSQLTYNKQPLQAAIIGNIICSLKINAKQIYLKKRNDVFCNEVNILYADDLA